MEHWIRCLQAFPSPKISVNLYKKRKDGQLGRSKLGFVMLREDTRIQRERWGR